MENSNSLMPSGAGADLGPAHELLKRPDELSAALISNGGLLLMTGLELDDTQFNELANLFDEVVRLEGNVPQDTVVIEAQEDDPRSIHSNGRLPLHSDGVLQRRQVDLVLLYCKSPPTVPEAGATIVVDQVAALNEMPEHLKCVLRIGMDYRVIDQNFFTDPEARKWSHIPAIANVDGRTILNLALPFSDDDKAAWQCKIHDQTRKDSKDLLDQLSEFLMRAEYSYRHIWKEGDLLLLDNSRTLHGRDSIGSAERTLWRLQGVLSDLAPSYLDDCC